MVTRRFWQTFENKWVSLIAEQFFQNSFVPWYSAPNKEAVQWRDKRGIFTSFAAFLLIVSIYPTRGIRMLYAQSLSFTCTSWVTVVWGREHLVFLPLYALKKHILWARTRVFCTIHVLTSINTLKINSFNIATCVDKRWQALTKSVLTEKI